MGETELPGFIGHLSAMSDSALELPGEAFEVLFILVSNTFA